MKVFAKSTPAMRGMIYLLGICLLSLLSSSCKSLKDVTYLQDMEYLREYKARYDSKSTIKPEDNIRIVVSSSRLELAAPFNQSVATQVRVTGDGTVGTQDYGSSLDDRKTVYRVNQKGMINFPVLGMIQAGGMTIDELQSSISNAIINGGYLADPKVYAEYADFSFYTLGALGSGKKTVQSGSINLLEAIAMAGGINENGDFERVLVLRKSGDGYIMIPNNVKSTEVISSPAFYLQQGDLIYVPQRYLKDEKEDTFWRYFSRVVSVISVPMTIMLGIDAIKRFRN